jgi:ribosome-binding factor A
MPEESKRSQRVGELLMHELGQLLVEGLRDPRIGFTTVTEVRVTPDLKQARVYISVYGSAEEQQRTLKALQAAASYLRGELGRRLELRYTPALSFVVDDSLARAGRVEQIMAAISAGETEVPAPSAVSPVPVQTDRSEMADSARSLAALPESPPPRRPRRHKRRRRQP